MAFARTAILLFFSNILMTFAWYGHLHKRFKDKPLWMVIPFAWGLAFFEYCLAIPANRLGKESFSTFQLKILQEAITLLVFVGFAVFYLREPMKWNHAVSFGLIVLAVFFAFRF